MAEHKLCMRNKVGYCKYKQMCHLRHVDIICENVNCEVKSCDKRHPIECWWFNQYGMCKFRFCAYKHAQKVDQLSILKAKIDTLEEKIKEKEIEMKLQEHKIREIETKQREKELETKVNNLEKFVIKLQERFEIKESELCIAREYNPKESGWANFDILVRRDLQELKCDDCDYIARNSVRLKSHIEVHHRYMCQECTEKTMDTLFKTKEELDEHNKIIHENPDQFLTEGEIKNLNETNLDILRKGFAGTPKRKDFERRYNLRMKQTNLKY